MQTAVASLTAALLLTLTACSAQPAPAPAARPPAEPAAPATAPAAPAPAAPATPSSPASPAAPAAVPPLSPPVAVKVGGLGIAAEAGIYIAMGKGYFRDEGLDVEFIQFGRGAEQMPALATGELHFGSGAPDPSHFNAVARGIDVKIVGINDLVNQDYNATYLVVRQDLLDSGRYKELRDLKGLNLAVSGTGTVATIYLERILARGGLSLDDVTFTNIFFPDMMAALANKAVDAAWLTEPFLNAAESQGLGQRTIGMNDVYRGLITQALLLSPVFAREQPEAARRFVTAHLRGQRDYYRAMIRQDGSRDEVLQILSKHTSIKDPAENARMGTHGVSLNGEIDEQVLSDMQDYYIRYGTQQQKVDVAQVVDHSYLDYALQRLGPFQ
ncbi:MAG TPA: ABC transporter substrate-binding protein [Chloroflexota bacterium]